MEKVALYSILLAGKKIFDQNSLSKIYLNNSHLSTDNSTS